MDAHANASARPTKLMVKQDVDKFCRSRRPPCAEDTVLCLRLENVDWSCRPKHQQVHCCLTPRCSEQIGVRTAGERWLSLGRHSTGDDDLFCQVTRISYFQKRLRQPYGNPTPRSKPVASPSLLMRCNTLRLKQRSAVHQSMHSEP